MSIHIGNYLPLTISKIVGSVIKNWKVGRRRRFKYCFYIIPHPPALGAGAVPPHLHAVAAVAGKVYVAGGFGGGTALEIYGPASDRWSRGASVPQALHHAATVGIGGKLYLVGGFAEGWNPVDSVYEYDPRLDRWRARASLPTARGALAVGAMSGPPLSQYVTVIAVWPMKMTESSPSKRLSRRMSSSRKTASPPTLKVQLP